MQEARELIFGPKEKHLSIYLKLVLFGPKMFREGAYTRVWSWAKPYACTFNSFRHAQI